MHCSGIECRGSFKGEKPVKGHPERFQVAPNFVLPVCEFVATTAIAILCEDLKVVEQFALERLLFQ